MNLLRETMTALVLSVFKLFHTDLEMCIISDVLSLGKFIDKLRLCVYVDVCVSHSAVNVHVVHGVLPEGVSIQVMVRVVLSQ